MREGLGGVHSLFATDPRLVMFAQNICLLIFLLLGAALLLTLVFSSWIGARIAFWRHSQKQAEIERRRERYDSRGRRLPPTGRGLCDGCGRAAEVVYHLADGSRRCRSCFKPDLDEPVDETAEGD